jgi:hypothetical protein
MQLSRSAPWTWSLQAMGTTKKLSSPYLLHNSSQSAYLPACSKW